MEKAELIQGKICTIQESKLSFSKQVEKINKLINKIQMDAWIDGYNKAISAARKSKSTEHLLKLKK